MRSTDWHILKDAHKLSWVWDRGPWTIYITSITYVMHIMESGNNDWYRIDSKKSNESVEQACLIRSREKTTSARLSGLRCERKRSAIEAGFAVGRTQCTPLHCYLNLGNKLQNGEERGCEEWYRGTEAAAWGQQRAADALSASGLISRTIGTLVDNRIRRRRTIRSTTVVDTILWLQNSESFYKYSTPLFSSSCHA